MLTRCLLLPSRTLHLAQHKQLLGNRDKVDLESLAHQAGQISLSMPTGRDRGSQALAGDPVTPPEQQKITKAELEARVGKVDGYLTREQTARPIISRALMLILTDCVHQRARCCRTADWRASPISYAAGTTTQPGSINSSPGSSKSERRYHPKSSISPMTRSGPRNSRRRRSSSSA